MSFAYVTPEFVSAAASKLAGIGTSISQVNSAAAMSTTAIAAAGADGRPGHRPGR